MSELIDITIDADEQRIVVHGLSDITVPYTQSVDLAEALAVRYGEENVTLTLVDNTIHADDRLYTDEFLSGVAAFIGK